jgi:dynein heavy chain, axonemal
VQGKLTELSDTAETLELWVKVQLLWTSLESVFMGGDIAKQVRASHNLRVSNSQGP